MDNMESLLIALPVLIFSVVLHEVAHGWVARTQGDNTAAMLGRLTLNPIPHLDPWGSVVIPALLAFAGAPVLGWARPVPVNPRNFREYRKGDILVSLAGVTVNLLLAFAFTLVFVGLIWIERSVAGLGGTLPVLFAMAQAGIVINIVLMLFNLIPIPPLDGSHVLYHMLPTRLAVQYRELGRYGFFILIAFLWIGGFALIEVPLAWLMVIFTSLAQLLT